MNLEQTNDATDVHTHERHRNCRSHKSMMMMRWCTFIQLGLRNSRLCLPFPPVNFVNIFSNSVRNSGSPPSPPPPPPPFSVAAARGNIFLLLLFLFLFFVHTPTTNQPTALVATTATPRVAAVMAVFGCSGAIHHEMRQQVDGRRAGQSKV